MNARPPRSRRGLFAVVLVVAVLALLPMVVPPSSSTNAPGTTHAPERSTSPLASIASAVPSPSSAVALLGGQPAPSSGAGTFFSSAALPSASVANQACVAGLCYNVSNDVSTNYTSRGILAAAYTTLTDQSPCAGYRPYSVANIAFVTSTNRGQTWTPVRYLGNSDCASAGNGYPDAWQPSITSLANGTLVLVYVEFNLSAGALPPLTPAAWPPTQSRLVATESYTNGVTWTRPTVLNISNPAGAPPGVQYTPAFPSVTAFGQTIYVTWMSLSSEDSMGSIALIDSLNGGATWTPTIQVSTGYGAEYSMDPQALVTPNGNLFIAYTSNISYQSFFFGTEGFLEFLDGGTWAGSVWVASSATNGTYFNYSEVADSIPLYTPGWDQSLNPTSFGPFQTPAPQIAYSAADDALFVAFTAGQMANGSTVCNYFDPNQCLVGDLFFFSSDETGVYWQQGNIGSTVLNAAFVNPATTALNSTDSVLSVAMATDGAGNVQLEAMFYNGSVCFGTACGAATEVVFNTTDEGFSFSQPITVDATYTPDATAWNGEYGSALDLAGTPLFFWSTNTCPTWATTPCTGYPGSNLGVAQVELSGPFTGSDTTTIFFNESGLPSGLTWSASVMGNDRSGLSGSTLSVAGVPEGTQILWSVPNLNLTTAHYDANGVTTPASPGVLHRPLSVLTQFYEFVPVTFSLILPSLGGPACNPYAFFTELDICPTFAPSCWSFSEEEDYGCYNIYLSPVPPTGEEWMPYDAPISVGIDPLLLNCNATTGAFVFCDMSIWNLTLLGWSGVGPGSVSSPNGNITFNPTGPVTETATFLLTGECNWEYDSFGIPPLYYEGCVNLSAPLNIAEHGLPAGTEWGVSLSGAAGRGSTVATAPDEIIENNAGVGLGGIVPWNVPTANPTVVWKASSDVASTVALPLANTVLVNYTQVSYTALSVPVDLRTLGLPSGLAGNLSLMDLNTGTTYAWSVGSAGINATLPGGEYLVNASAILTTDGVSYSVAEVYMTSALVNETNQSALAPAAVVLGGASTVTIAFTPEDWVTIGAGADGSASPTSRWVPYGDTITLHAYADTGYHFLGWVGTGLGSTSGPQASLPQVVIQPGGPVTEVATFAVNGAPTWSVTVTPSGLPTGATYTVTLGGTSYSGAGSSLVIGNLSSGTYPLGFPTVPDVGSTIARASEVSVTASTGLSTGGTELTVDQNLTVSPVYATEYLVSITVVGSGTVSLGPGTYWESAQTTLDVLATPAAGQVFAGWSGSFDGEPSSLLTNTTLLSVTLTGSINAVARFSPAPPVTSATYVLTVQSSGLPSGTAWEFDLNGTTLGAAGTTSALTLGGLNGSYTVVVPTVYGAAGVRYVPLNVSSSSTPVTSNTSVTVAFQEQVLVSVAASGAGSAGGGGWYGYQTMVSLRATSTGGVFDGWSGSGAGSYSGMTLNASFLALGPVSETASFVPAGSASASNTASTPLLDYVGVGLVVAVLLGVGVAEGYLMARRRRPPPAAAAPRARPPPPTTRPSGTRSLPPARPPSGGGPAGPA